MAVWSMNETIAKAEGFADGGWQTIGKHALAAATHSLILALP